MANNYTSRLQGAPPQKKNAQFLALDANVIQTSCAYAKMSVSVCLSVRLSVTEVHCGHGACQEEGRVILRYASHC